MKTFKYEIPVWHINQTPIDLENPPEHWHIIEGVGEFDDFEDAWQSMVEECPYVVDREEVVVEEIA